LTPAVEAKGFKIPIVGLGTWALRDVTRIVEQAIRIGYRHIDTAQMYGNETEVGQGVRASGVSRAEVMVTTKVQPTNLAPHDLERSVKDSLAHLRLDVIDLLLIHWPNPRVPLSETLGAMQKMKRAGYVRAIGVSNFTVALLDEAAEITDELVCNQIEVHPFLNQDKVLAACKKHKLAVVAYSPVARGAAHGNAVLARIGKAHGKTAAQVSLRYLVQQGIVVIPRTNRLERLSENFALFDFSLTEAEMQEIYRLAHRGGRIVDWTWSPKWD
jgi:diketogulonate reductase-like aldo/keto reductase